MSTYFYLFHLDGRISRAQSGYFGCRCDVQFPIELFDAALLDFNNKTGFNLAAQRQEHW